MSANSSRKNTSSSKPPVGGVPLEGSIYYADEEELAAFPVSHLYHVYRQALELIYQSVSKPDPKAAALSKASSASAARPAAKAPNVLLGSLTGQNTEGDLRFEAVVPHLRMRFDELTRTLLNDQRPSNFTGANLFIYSFYRPVMTAAEREIEALLFDAIVLALKTDRIREALRRLDDRAYVGVYRNTARALIELISPPPHALDEYGNQDPKKPYLAIDPTRQDYLNAAVMEDLQFIFGKAASGGANVKTPREFLRYSLDQMAAVSLALQKALLIDYRRTIALLLVVSIHERDRIVAPAVDMLTRVWANVEAAFRKHVFRSTTLDELERTFTADIARRAEHTVAVLRSYERKFPLLDQHSGIEDAPSTRDNTLLLDTATGRRLINFYRLTRELDFRGTSGSIMKSLGDEIPQGLMFAGFSSSSGERADDVEMALSTTIYARTLGASVDKMDLIFFYFSVVQPSTPSQDTDDNGRSFYDVYWELLRTQELTAQAKANLKSGLTTLRKTRLTGDGTASVQAFNASGTASVPFVESLSAAAAAAAAPQGPRSDAI